MMVAPLCKFDILTVIFYLSSFIMNHTTVIIIITVAVSLMAWQNKTFLGRLVFDPISIARHKQYDRFLTSGFVHGDGMHLLFNMITLYFFGRTMERFYIHELGALGFVGFYTLAIIASSIPDYIRHKNNPRFASLGASGGVSAVLFAFILLAPWQTIYLFFIPIPAIIFAIGYISYSIWADRRGTGRINHLAHLSGAAFGVIATIIIKPTIVIHFMNAFLNPRF